MTSRIAFAAALLSSLHAPAYAQTFDVTVTLTAKEVRCRESKIFALRAPYIALVWEQIGATATEIDTLSRAAAGIPAEVCGPDGIPKPNTELLRSTVEQILNRFATSIGIGIAEAHNTLRLALAKL